MNIDVNELTRLETPEARRNFVLCNLPQFALDQDTEDITLHTSYQIKNEANILIRGAERHKGYELAGLLVLAAEQLPEKYTRARNLARARGLMVLANYHYDEGKYEQAEGEYREAQTLCLNSGNPLEALRCQMRLMDVLSRTGRPTEAARLIEPTLFMARESGDKRLLLSVLSNVGVVYHNMDEYTKAEKAYAEMLSLLFEINPDLPPDNHLALSYVGLGSCYSLQNRYTEALEIGEKAREVTATLGQVLLLAQSLRIIGIAYFNLGRYHKALNVWEKASQLLEKEGSEFDAHLVNGWRCYCLVHLNKEEDALELYSKLIKQAKENNWASSVAQLIYEQGVILFRQGCFSEAEYSYSEAEILFKNLHLSNWLANLHLDSAKLFLEMQLYQKSFNFLEIAEKEFVEQGIKGGIAQVYLVKARLARTENQLDKAHDSAYMALQIAKENELVISKYEAYLLLGELAEEKENPETALEYYTYAIEQVEKLRGSVTLELRGDFLKDKDHVYEGLVYLTLQQTDMERAYDYIERAKSRALTEMLASEIDLRVKPRNETDKPLLGTLNRLREEYGYYYQLTNSFSGNLNTQLRGGGAELLNQEQAQAIKELLIREKKIEEILLQLQFRNVDYAEDLSLIEVKSESPQPLLDNQTLIIEYYFARDMVLALAISKHEKRYFSNLTSVVKLTRAMETLSLNLQLTSPEKAQGSTEIIQKQLQLLYKQLFAPLAGFAQNFQKLIIVPHGLLHYLPFHALWDGEKYLVEDFEISYLPASSQLKYYRQRAEAVTRENGHRRSLVMGFSNYGSLDYVEQEAQEIAKLLGENTRLYTETQAEKSILEGLDEAYRVIHLASHGQFRSDAPLFSFIELSNSVLLTTDIFNLQLRAGLVTLSACESGLNAISGGDELNGLSRACLYAGAASLLLSLWQVEDGSTTLLMKDFYRRLVAGKTKATALREAQVALLKGELDTGNKTNYQHPYFWAPFFLIGDTGTL